MDAFLWLVTIVAALWVLQQLLRHNKTKAETELARAEAALYRAQAEAQRLESQHVAAHIAEVEAQTELMRKQAQAVTPSSNWRN